MNATTISLNPVLLIGALASACLVAGAIGTFVSRSLSRGTERVRDRDTVFGYIGRNGDRHLGVVEKVNGYSDASGEWHPGLDEIVEEHDEWITQHEEHAT